MSIYQKLAAVRSEVPYMAKGGRNSSQGYNFLQEAQVTEMFKELLEKHGIWLTVQSEVTGVTLTPSQNQNLTTVRVDYAFVDIETGETLEGHAAGQGTDANDKGVYKAITGAVKYIFMKHFLIVTGDDPENDTPQPQAAAGRSQAYAPPGVPFGEED